MRINNMLLLGILGVGLWALMNGKINMQGNTEPTSQLDPNRSGVGIHNPAAAYCIQHGGRYQVGQTATGGQIGFCVLPNGQSYEEWDCYRRKLLG